MTPLFIVAIGPQWTPLLMFSHPVQFWSTVRGADLACWGIRPDRMANVTPPGWGKTYPNKRLRRKTLPKTSFVNEETMYIWIFTMYLPTYSVFDATVRCSAKFHLV